MKGLQTEITNILQVFYKSTGIGAIFSDTQLNLTTHPSIKKTTYNFSFLGMSEISTYLAEVFSKPPMKDSAFYTYCLPNNLLCNIVFVRNADFYIGAFITEPVSIKKLTKPEVEKLLDNSYFLSKDRKTLETILLKLPVIPHDNINSMGTVLFQLSRSLIYEAPQQILCGSSMSPNVNMIGQKPNKKYTFDLVPIEKDDSSYTTFLQLIEYIKSGNTELLINTINKISIGKLPVDQLCSSDYIRSLKNSYIKALSIVCYIAIDVTASYNKMMDLTDTYISEMEDLDNINDIYAHFQTAIISLTNAVAKSNGTIYSKPVHLVMEYIHTRYADKITLETLSNYTKLSVSYLSKQIKKETGTNLLENINKIRVEKSKEMLLNLDISILDVAQSVGFTYQNHFASIFKKYTNYSPNEYRKTMGQVLLTSDNPTSDKTLPLVAEQIKEKLFTFSKLYDVVRIIDPIYHKYVIIKSNEANNSIKKCCHYNKKNKFCEDCIAKKSYLQNDAIFKFEQHCEHSYLITAIPIEFDQKVYIVEIVIDVSNKILFKLNSKSNVNNLFENFMKPLINEYDEVTGLYNRVYINKHLPIDMRRCNLERTSMFIILFVIEDFDLLHKYTPNDYVFRKFADMITKSFITPMDWAGRYGGEIYLLALNDTNYETTYNIAENIKKDFNNTAFELDEKTTYFTVNYGMKDYSEEIIDSETFIKHAFMHLNVD